MSQFATIILQFIPTLQLIRRRYIISSQMYFPWVAEDVEGMRNAIWYGLDHQSSIDSEFYCLFDTSVTFDRSQTKMV